MVFCRDYGLCGVERRSEVLWCAAGVPFLCCLLMEWSMFPGGAWDVPEGIAKGNRSARAFEWADEHSRTQPRLRSRLLPTFQYQQCQCEWQKGNNFTLEGGWHFLSLAAAMHGCTSWRLYLFRVLLRLYLFQYYIVSSLGGYTSLECCWGYTSFGLQAYK